jgi:hypothetical protein
MMNFKHLARRRLPVSIGIVMLVVISSALYAATQPSPSTPRAALQGTITVDEDQEPTFPALAKLTLQDAIAAAQAAVPGQVLSVGLEEEDGYLVYEVEIVEAQGAITEVLVDAGNGTVLQMEQDHKDEDDDCNDDR